MNVNKPRIIKDYDALTIEIQEQIKLFYPNGFERKLITFKNAKGAIVSALPFETDDKYYLVRMTKSEALDIVEGDEDYNDEGQLKESVAGEYSDKYESEDDDGIEEEIGQTVDADEDED